MQTVLTTLDPPEGAQAAVLDGASPRAWRLARGAARGAGAAVLWSGLGFLSGAFFWHSVGFWGFVSSVVLKGPDSAPVPALVRQARPVAEFGSRLRESITADGPPLAAHGCVELMLDRGRAMTVAKPCEGIRGLSKVHPQAPRADALEMAVTADQRTTRWATRLTVAHD